MTLYAVKFKTAKTSKKKNKRAFFFLISSHAVTPQESASAYVHQERSSVYIALRKKEYVEKQHQYKKKAVGRRSTYQPVKSINSKLIGLLYFA